MTEGEGNADDGRAPFLAAEACLHGQPLSVLAERAQRRGERLAPELVAWIGARAAEGLRDVHALLDDEGNPLTVAHGAVTPENVFLTYDGCVALIGEGDAAADPRADIVLLARTLYEAAVGEPPAQGGGESPSGVRSPASIVPGFPEELAGILVRVLEEELTLATPSASELAAELDHFAGRNASEASLAELLAAWFEDERQAPVVVEGLPALRDLVRSLPPGPVSAAPLAASLRPASHEKPSRWGIVVLACAVLLAAGSVLTVKLSRGPAPSPAPAARPVTEPSAAAAPSAVAGIGSGTAALTAEKADAGGVRFVP